MTNQSGPRPWSEVQNIDGAQVLLSIANPTAFYTPSEMALIRYIHRLRGPWRSFRNGGCHDLVDSYGAFLDSGSPQVRALGVFIFLGLHRFK
jgi:hypothetical protein